MYLYPNLLPSDFIENMNLPLALLTFFPLSFLTCSLWDELHCLAQLPKSSLLLLLCWFGDCKTRVLGKNATRRVSLAGSASDPISITRAFDGTGYAFLSFETF